MIDPFWQTIQVPAGETRHWEFGRFSFWIRHIEGEWQIATKMTMDDELESRWTLAAPAEFPSETTYQRFAFDISGGGDFITLKPEYPDRSIVSKPTMNLQVPPYSEANFFCGVAMWVKVLAGSELAPKPLTTLPLISLSKTWFGSPLEGEACYASSTNATRDYRNLEPLPYRVVCPVKIMNRTPDPLPFERICIRVKHLKIYQGETYLWSNDIRVTKTSSQELSQVSYAATPPEIDPTAVEIAPSREKVSGGIFLRTFNNLRRTIDIH
ncbi:MAG: hypothetical protein P1V20_27125 [Verrucomicrobiales bacterium]|nr:hypothetical protein [Verrucomicrobiales bacterium]